MQPSSTQGNKLRLALKPISLGIAAIVMWIHSMILCAITGDTILDMVRSSSPMSLVVIVPSLLLGIVVGFIAINLFSFIIPPFREIFERESTETGRQGFCEATKGLTKVALILLLLTLAGSIIHVRYE